MRSLEARLARVDDGICRAALAQLWRLALPKERVPIVEWVGKHVDLSFDRTASASGPMRPYPYQIEPLEATEDPEVHEITLQWGQRLGKSTVWRMSMLKRVADGGLSGLIVYPSLELGMKMNRDTVLPLLETLPEVKRDLAVRGGKKRDSFHIPSQSSVVYFLGAGAQVVSLTANWCVLDETDFVSLQKSDDEGKNMSQLKAVRLRMQTFRERLLIVCSSPSNVGGTVHQNWLRGSRGEWSLRCLSCGALSPTKQLAFILPDGHYAGLQWEKDDSGDVIADSIRWVCPVCGHRHVESDAPEMNRQGAYVHARPNAQHRSFQCGALANPQTWTWKEIALAQEDAIDADGKKYLANTVLAVPYRHVREGDASVSIAEVVTSRQVGLPADLGQRLSIVVAAVDQQKSELAGEKYYVWVVRGWDEQGNSWLLASGTANSLDALGDALDADYLGHRVALALIDQGGFDTSQDLDPFVASRRSVFYYKGEDDRTLKGRPWMPSATNAKLFLANAIRYQVRLLSLLYDPPRPVGHRWQLPEQVSDVYFAQLTAVRPNLRMTKDGNGEAYQNWCAQGQQRRDFFDAEKMALVALDVACHYLPPTAFPTGNKPLFVRQEWLRQLIREKRAQK